MKETGIIMSGDHPKLILDGRKTQTRRVIKPQPRFVGAFIKNGIFTYDSQDENAEPSSFITCPYGRSGDRLWVRETWDYIFGSDGDYLIYKADKESLNWFNERKKQGSKITWKPSIHLLKRDARIWLEITEVRVERLQEITEEDAKAEGVLPEGDGWHNYVSVGCISTSARQSFISLWQKIHLWKYEQKRWEVNPWVWVISFKIL